MGLRLAIDDYEKWHDDSFYGYRDSGRSYFSNCDFVCSFD